MEVMKYLICDNLISPKDPACSNKYGEGKCGNCELCKKFTIHHIRSFAAAGTPSNVVIMDEETVEFDYVNKRGKMVV